MHNPSDETEQYDEPETIVQRHGGVELPFKHHEGGTAGGGGRGAGDEAIKLQRTRRSLSDGHAVKFGNPTKFGKNQSTHSRPQWEPHSYHAEHARVQTRGAPRKRRRSRRLHLGSSKLASRRSPRGWPVWNGAPSIPSPGRARRRASRARVPRRAARRMCARCASASRTPASAAAQSTLTAP